MSSTEMSPNFSINRYATGDRWSVPHYSEPPGAPALPGTSRNQAADVASQQSGVALFESSGRFIRPAMEVVNSAPAIGDTPSIDDLFSQLAGSTLSSALLLLDEALARSQKALDVIDSDPVSADDEMQQLQAILPELFCCRTIGDGFGALINSIQYALVNQKGLPLSKSQISSLLGGIRKLRGAPFIGFEDAVNLAITFENAGLVIDPPALSDLADEPTE